ncbi:terminus macrodomain insulation protein YfbV [Planctobacterium marinum]|uniref:terminus macrodomain insulation protein YfbV n=1 Tax=Planctobacterium marinum TaxID=1631968 RepID=UPI001E3285CD|nr:terminus macrodomain insulation protein YfbV [Planctobacterium marinum]MCC2604556.1 DUF412 domain-containing protein [Planctobacterium marinum]
MAHSFGTILRDGQEYMKVWPRQKQLFSLFPDGKVVLATEFAIKVMPPAAVIAAASLINIHGAEYAPQAIAIAAFFMSLPLQGLMWLGHRSKQSLPPAIKGWYQEIHTKMRQQGCELQSAKARPRYKELAQLLKTAFEELDKVFTRQLF